MESAEQLGFLQLEDGQCEGRSLESVVHLPLRSPFDERTLTVSGLVERVIYFNEETGECVLETKSEETKNKWRLSVRLPFVYPGLPFEAQILIPEKFQFDGPATFEALASFEDVAPWPARDFRETFPKTARALKKFLKSDAFPEIGPSLATVLSKAFPQDFFSVLLETPEKLLKIQGIGKKRAQQIRDSFETYLKLCELKKFCFAEKLPLSWARVLFAANGPDALLRFKKDPYQSVLDLEFSFELIDTFALKHGAPLDSRPRLRAGFHDLLLSHYRQGHCAYPEKLLIEEVCAALEVSPEEVEELIELELIEERVISDEIAGEPCLYLARVWKMERQVADTLLSFLKKEPPWGWFNLDRALTWAQDLLDIRLAPLQKEAIQTSLSSALTVITGGPGTGKTTLIRSLVTILRTQFSKFALCSPTGRAAQRLSEATAHPALTIHRLLKFDARTGKFTFNRERPLDLDLVLIDEVSMVDLALMSSLLEALPEHCALILVGDADQIPSVGAGTILQSILAADRFNVVRLTEIYRQKQASSIKVNAQRINHGEMPFATGETKSDFHYIPVYSVDQTKRVVFDLVTKVIPERYGICDPGQTQILVPMNRGALGTKELNGELQKCMARAEKRDERGLTEFGFDYKVGDKVMVLKNDYNRDVFNGDVGFIREINYFSQCIDVEFDGRTVSFGFHELDRLTLAYAISIHKSQGSEYRAVVVVIGLEHLPLAQRHLIYTAVTRGKDHVFLVAHPNALEAAIATDEKRCEKLTELLRSSQAPDSLESLSLDFEDEMIMTI